LKASSYHKPVGSKRYVEKAESIYNQRGRNKDTSNYHPYYPVNPNFGISAEIESAQNRASGLYFENAIAAGIINAMVDGAIGTGLTPQAKANAKILGIEQKKIDETQRIIEAYWQIWSTKPNLCDHYHNQTFGSLQREAFVNACVCGDVLQNIKIVRSGNAFLPQVQNIAGNNVRNKYLFDSESIAGGVEVDAQGREVAYHIIVTGPDMATENSVRYAKFGSRTGRLMFNLVKLGQVVPAQRRGRSILSRVAEPIIQMGRYSEAELTKAILQSYMTLFIETAEGHEEYPQDNPLMKLQESSIWDGPRIEDADGHIIESGIPQMETPITLGPGIVWNLKPGEKAVLPESKAPVSEFWKFMESQMKMVGMAVSIPYEVLLKAFNSNYSASQAAIQDAARGWKILSTEWAYKYCQPVYEQFVEMLVRQNVIDCPGFFDSPIIRSAWCNAEWFGPTVLNIDPVKNIKTSIDAINNRLSTREIEARKLFGNDWESVNERLGEEEDMIVAAGGTVPLADGQQVPQSGGNGDEDK